MYIKRNTEFYGDETESKKPITLKNPMICQATAPKMKPERQLKLLD